MYKPLGALLIDNLVPAYVKLNKNAFYAYRTLIYKKIVLIYIYKANRNKKRCDRL